ncbi:MAG: hypothetical protein ACI8WB_001639 [Phenylobacterium sp.]
MTLQPKTKLRSGVVQAQRVRFLIDIVVSSASAAKSKVLMKVPGVCLYCINKVWQFIAVFLVIIAVVISLLKYSLPHVGVYRDNIQQWVFDEYGAQINIGNITAGWDGIGPAILLQDLSFEPNAVTPLDLQIKEVRLKLDFWTTLKDRQLTSDYFILDGFVATIDSDQLLQRNEDADAVDDPIIDALSELLLGQLKEFSMTNSVIKLKTPDNLFHLGIEQLAWYNDEHHHQGTGELSIDGFAANSLSFVLDLQGTHRDNLKGQLYIEASNLDISPWLGQFISPESQLEKSNINFQSWTDVNYGVLGRAEITLGDNEIAWRRNNRSQQLTFAQSQLLWTPTWNGWAISSNEIGFGGDGGDWPALSFNLNKNADSYDLFVNQWAVERVAQLVSLTIISAAARASLASYQPQALIEDFHLQFSGANDFKVNGAYRQLGWNHVDGVPGAQGLTGHFGMADGAGWLNIQGTDGKLLTGSLFKAPISYQNLDLNLAFIKDEQDIWQLHGDNIWLHNSHLDMVAEFSMSLGDKPQIQLYAELSAEDLMIADYYYPPEYIGQPAIDYLNGAIKAGKTDFTQVLWSGDLKAFPYDHHEGIFLVNVLLSDVDFLFTTGWPVLSDIDGQLLFKNDTLTIVPYGGYFLDIEVAGKVEARLPSLSNPQILELDIDATESAAKAAKLFKASPLRDIFNPVFEQIKVRDQVVAKAQIILPLEDDDAFFDANFVAKGEIAFVDNAIEVKTPGISLSQVNGLLKFHNDKIWTQGMTASWFEMPLKAMLSGEDAPEGFELAIKIDADVDTKQLLSTFDNPLAAYVDGVVPLHSNIDLAFPSTGVRYEAYVKANLAPAMLSLPAPYQKSEGIDASLNAYIKGDEISSLITANFDQRLFFNSILPHNQAQFSQAHLILGPRDLGLAGDGFTISVDLAKTELMPWYRFVDNLVNYEGKSKQAAILPTPGLIAGKVAQVSGFGQQLHGVNFEVTEGNGSWDALINAKETRSSIHFDRDWLGKGITITTDYLKLPGPDDEDEANNEAQQDTMDSAAFITGLPPITFTCLDCQYGLYNLHRVDFETSADKNQLNITKLTIDKGKHQLKATGQWLGDEGNGTMGLSGRLTSDNFGNLLNEYELTSSVRDSDAKIDFFANWAGGPHQFNAPSLSGELKWSMGEGHLSEVSDRGIRLLSLLSFDSIVRKLKLDFRDVFSKGFFYNSMQGTMLIEGGIAYTDNTTIDGVPADLVFKGSTNLVDQTLDYNLAFTPKYTSSLPTLIAFLVNPISGIAALGLNEVFESKVISQVHFTLTGTISEPVVTETDRQSRDIKLPARTVTPINPVNPSELLLPLIPGERQTPSTESETTPKVDGTDQQPNRPPQVRAEVDS